MGGCGASYSKLIPRGNWTLASGFAKVGAALPLALIPAAPSWEEMPESNRAAASWTYGRLSPLVVFLYASYLSLSKWDAGAVSPEGDTSGFCYPKRGARPSTDHLGAS